MSFCVAYCCLKSLWVALHGLASLPLALNHIGSMAKIPRIHRSILLFLSSCLDILSRRSCTFSTLPLSVAPCQDISLLTLFVLMLSSNSVTDIPLAFSHFFGQDCVFAEKLSLRSVERIGISSLEGSLFGRHHKVFCSWDGWKIDDWTLFIS